MITTFHSLIISPFNLRNQSSQQHKNIVSLKKFKLYHIFKWCRTYNTLYKWFFSLFWKN